MEQLHSILGARSEYNNTEGVKSDLSSVLALCTGAPWFPPLTVTAPTRNMPLVTVTLPEKIQVDTVFCYFKFLSVSFTFYLSINL